MLEKLFSSRWITSQPQHVVSYWGIGAHKSFWVWWTILFLTVVQGPADQYKLIPQQIVLWIGLLKYLPTRAEERGGRRVGGCLLKLHKLSHIDRSFGSRQSCRGIQNTNPAEDELQKPLKCDICLWMWLGLSVDENKVFEWIAIIYNGAYWRRQ